MKIGVVGKGGVGKTTVSSLLVEALVARGYSVLAVDTDSNPNLGTSLGLPVSEVDAMPVIPRAAATGAGGGATTTALVAEYGRQTPAGATLVCAMRIGQAGAG